MGDDIHVLQFMPEIVLDKIFSFVDISDFVSCMLVCKNWYRIFECERSKPWSAKSRHMIPDKESGSASHSRVRSPRDVVRSFCHGWNPPPCCTSDIRVRPDGVTVFNVSKTLNTRANVLCTKIGYKQGVHEWEFNYKTPIGVFEMIGLTMSDTPLSTYAFTWGWEIITQTLYGNSTSILSHYPTESGGLNTKDDFTVRMVLDCERHEVRFEWNNVCLGVAFTDLPRVTLYPTITFVGSLCERSITYIDNVSNNS